MEYRTTDLRTGLFVALSILAGTVLVFMMGNVRGAFRESREVKFRFANVHMLEVEAPVTIGGYRVGEVIGVQRIDVESPDGTSRSEIEVTLAVDESIRVRDDATAMVRQAGLLGSNFIALDPGQSATAYTAGRVLAGTAEAQLSDVINDLRRPLAQASEVLAEIHTLVSADESTVGSPRRFLHEATLLAQRARGETLTKVEGLSDTIGREVVKLSEQLRETTRRLEARLDVSLQGVDGLTRSLTNRSEEAKAVVAGAENTVIDMRGAIVDARALISRLEKAVGKADAGVARVVDGADRLLTDNNRNIFVMIQQLRDTAVALERSARKVQADPSVLIWGDDEPVRTPTRDLGIEGLRESGRAKRYEKEPGR